MTYESPDTALPQSPSAFERVRDVILDKKSKLQDVRNVLRDCGDMLKQQAANDPVLAMAAMTLYWRVMHEEEAVSYGTLLSMIEPARYESYSNPEEALNVFARAWNEIRNDVPDSYRQEIKNLIETLCQTLPNNSAIHGQHAYELLKEERYEDAHEFLEQTLARPNMQNTALYKIKGDVYFQQKNFKDAITCYEDSHSRVDKDKTPLYLVDAYNLFLCNHPEDVLNKSNIFRRWEKYAHDFSKNPLYAHFIKKRYRALAYALIHKGYKIYGAQLLCRAAEKFPQDIALQDDAIGEGVKAGLKIWVEKLRQTAHENFPTLNFRKSPKNNIQQKFDSAASLGPSDLIRMKKDAIASLKEDFNSLDNWLNLIEALEKAKENIEISLLKTAHEKCGNNFKISFLYAQALTEQNDRLKAYKIMERFDNPADRARNMRGLFMRFLQEHNFYDAEDILFELCGIYQRWENDVKNYAETCFYARQPVMAFKILQKALERNDQDPVLNHFMGRAYLYDGQGESAVPYLMRALENYEYAHTTVALELSKAYCSCNEYEAAKEIIQQYCSLENIRTKRHGDMLMNLYLQTEDYESFEQNMENFLNQKSAKTAYIYAKYFFKTGRDEMAAQTLEEYVLSCDTNRNIQTMFIAMARPGHPAIDKISEMMSKRSFEILLDKAENLRRIRDVDQNISPANRDAVHERLDYIL